MNFQEIQILTKCLPAAGLGAILPAKQTRGVDWEKCPFKEQEMLRFVRCYNKFDFAWKAASILAAEDCILPIFPHGSDKWFYRAWLLLKNTAANENNPIYDPIKEAWAYEHMPEERPTRELIRALLIAPGATTERVAEVLNIPHENVEAYECLFFNAIARKDDSLFLRNQVYPHTKMEEYLPGYFEKANMGTVLLRLGYNHSMDDVLYFAGMRIPSYAEGITVAQAFEDFQHKTMSNGLILATFGFGNYSIQMPGLSAARGLASAARIGGSDTGGADDGMGDFAGAARAVLEGNKKIVEASIEVIRR